jgi:hypothetical protein
VGQSGFIDVLGVWAVGTPPTVYPDGVGRWIRKGQQTPDEPALSPEWEGANRSNARRSVLRQGRFEERSRVSSCGRYRVSHSCRCEEPRDARALPLDQDINIVSYFPHMHFRGKDMTLTALLPDGNKQTLLRVPAYDFNWQLYYYPTTPVPLPRGYHRRSRRALRQLGGEPEQSGSDA